MKDNIFIRELRKEDAKTFIEAMQVSQYIHSQWVSSAQTYADFDKLLTKFSNDDNYCFLICSDSSPDKILGVVNVTQIIRGVFQNGFLSYYVTHYGYKRDVMFKGVNLVIQYCFDHLHLHRLEANIQPNNYASIRLVERLDFTLEGFSKDYLFINGMWRDHKRYALLNNKLKNI